MWYLIRWMLFGPPSHWPGAKKVAPEGTHQPESGKRPFAEVENGPMRIRFWRNTNMKGQVYFNLDLVRVVNPNQVAKYFKGNHLEDVRAVTYKAQAWLRENVADLTFK